MKEPEDEIPNLDFPIATIIRESLMALPPDQKKEVLESMTADEFSIHRVDIYLIALENAMHRDLMRWVPRGSPIEYEIYHLLLYALRVFILHHANRTGKNQV